MVWGIQWRSCNKIDGKREYLLGCLNKRADNVPPFVAGYSKMAFKSRKEAREYIKKNFGYIKNRSDLRAEPHGWKMPIPIKISVEINLTA